MRCRLQLKLITGLRTLDCRKLLQEEKVLNPTAYKRRVGIKTPSPETSDPYHWNTNTVVHILERREYTGCTVNFKTYTNSIWDKKQRDTPLEKQAVFYNTHPAIIEQEIFDKVQEIRQQRHRRTKTGKSSLFSGMVYCADCGERLYNHRRRYNLADGTERILSYFNCSTYTLTIQREKTLCCSHYINNDALNELLLMTIRTVSKYALRDEEDFIRRIRSTTEVKQANEAKALQRSIAKAKKRSAELDVLIKRLYESYVLEKLPEKRYEALSAEYEHEQAELEEAIAQDQAKLDAYQADSTNVEAFIQLAKKYRDVPELTPGMVNEFVDKILSLIHI